MKTLPLGGFNYDNCLRNKALEANLPKGKQLSYTKTGTTICGVIFNVSGEAKAKIRIFNQQFSFRKESLLQPILVPLEEVLSVIRTARRSTTLLQTFSAVALEPLLIVTMSLVSVIVNK